MLELGVVLSEKQGVLSLAHDLCLLRQDSVEKHRQGTHITRRHAG